MAPWGEWECMECGYVTMNRRRPSRCPECGAPGEAFDFLEYEDDEDGEEDLDEGEMEEDLEEEFDEDDIELLSEEDEWSDFDDLDDET
ncbi:MAG: hypothetical protein Kow0047_14960 [Anaerolineae bacterium]